MLIHKQLHKGEISYTRRNKDTNQCSVRNPSSFINSHATPNIWENSFSALLSPSLFSHCRPSKGMWAWFLFSGSIQTLEYSRSRNLHWFIIGAVVLVLRVCLSKECDTISRVNWIWVFSGHEAIENIHQIYLFWGWCESGWVGVAEGGWMNPVAKLSQRWEWKGPIIALWRIKTTSANSPNICVVPQSGSFTASGFPGQINSAEVYTRVDCPPLYQRWSPPLCCSLI